MSDIVPFSLNLYEAWFEAQSPSVVNNVYHIDMHNINVNQELKSDLQKGKLLVLFSPEIQTTGNSVDRAFDSYKSVFFVVHSVNLKANNAEALRKTVRNDTLEACKSIRNNILAIVSDDTIQCHFFKNADFRSFKFNKLGPVFVNMYGWACEFEFKVPI